jgi:radical SAM protein with 4Fe4S-binding SPASM domain
MPWRNFKTFLSKIFKQPAYAVKAASKRMKAYFSYYAGRGRASLPEAITLFLTHRCNLRCRMCGQWGESGVTREKSRQDIAGDMSIEELKKIVNDVSVFRPNITLFGGEPLLHLNASDLISHIKRKGLHCLMITNGSMIAKMADELVDSGLNELNVSVDGRGELHDEIRGVPGLFEKITDGLKLVTELKKQKKIKHPLINLQCTINKDNYRQLEDMVAVAEHVGADSITFHNLIFLNSDVMERQRGVDRSLNCSSENWNGFVFEPGIDPEFLNSKIKEIIYKPHNVSIDFYPNFSSDELKDYYLNPSYTSGNGSARCVSPWMAAYIFPDGELRPCLNLDYSFGNMRTGRFAHLWNSDQAVKFRRSLNDNRIFPACIRCTELYRY